MKNLFLMGCMLFCFGIASAQETPQKKKSSTKTDTVYNKKNKQHPTRTSDTVHKSQAGKKKGTTKPTTTSPTTTSPTTVPQRTDSINGTRP